MSQDEAAHGSVTDEHPHDARPSADELLGPPDLAAWGSAAAGAGIGLLVVAALLVATAT